MIDDLYSLKLDEDEEKNKKRNKMNSSINIGLLEKTNKCSKKVDSLF